MVRVCPPDFVIKGLQFILVFHSKAIVFYLITDVTQNQIVVEFRHFVFLVPEMLQPQQLCTILI